MRRKINLVGQNTLTVSLPSTWVRKQQIEKGDEIEVMEDGKKLILSKEYTPKIETTIVDVSDQTNMLHRIIAAIYKSGYDEASIIFSKSDELKRIQRVIETKFSDFDIVEYRKNKVDLKAITKFDSKHFDSVFKKIFFIIQDISQDLYVALSKKKLR